MTAAESPIFAFSGGGAAVEATAAAPAAPTALATGGDPRLEVTPPSGLATMLKPTVLSGSRARLLPHPDMMVTMGTVIPCTLQTAIDSQLAGYVKCVLPQDVRSTTGNVVLLDRGTTVVGEIGRGLAQGQDRIFVLWDRAETPDHAVIELSSPGTDELGRSGLPGGVNNHWWERFGSAILLSVIQGGLADRHRAGGHLGVAWRHVLQLVPGQRDEHLRHRLAGDHQHSAHAGEEPGRQRRHLRRQGPGLLGHLQAAPDRRRLWPVRPRRSCGICSSRSCTGWTIRRPRRSPSTSPARSSSGRRGCLPATICRSTTTIWKTSPSSPARLRRQDVGPRSPLCATELPGGERLQICLPPSVPAGTASLTIRRPGTSVSALADVGKRYHTARWNKWEHAPRGGGAAERRGAGLV